MAESAEVGMDENEWELSKENILPLRGGRVISDLTQALRPSADHTAMVKQQRQQFEVELMTYRGDDPLEIWTRYINWIQQTFPKGGKESHIDEVLHKCVTAFKGDHRFDNDPRYLSIWIKFANICKDPLEIYKYMFDNKIGHKLASFYEAWASELEHVGNTKKADTVYLQGLENGAEPLELLRQRQSELHARVARRVAGEIVAPPEPVTVVEEPRRHALGALKGRRSGMMAPVERVSSGVESRVRIPQQAVAPAANRRQFQILNDENADPSSLMQATGQYHNIPAKATHKENTQAAGVWANKKVKQRNVPVVKLNEITTVSKPEFAVFTDDDEPAATPQRKPVLESRPLSARKLDSCQDPFYSFTHTMTEPGMMVMYPKDKVYCGGIEFQLEEIRAYKWVEIQRQAEERRIKEEIEREREQIRLERERLEKERALLQQQRQRQQVEIITQKNTDVERSFQDNKSVPAAGESSILQANVDSTVELLGYNNVFNNKTAAGALNASSAMPTAAKGILSSAGSSQSLHEQTQNLSLHATPNSGSLDTTKDSLKATVYTKQALSTILGEFNQTLDLRNEFGWKTNENAEPMETETHSEIEREREQIRLERERLEKERAILEQQQQRQQVEIITEKNTDVERSFQDNRSVPAAVESSILQAGVDSTVELLGYNNVFNNKTAAGALNASSAMPTAAKGILSSAGSSQSLHEQTQNLSLHATPNSGSLDTTKDSLTATIHTKQALSAILGMFNQTIDLRNEFGWKTNEDAEPMETETHSDKIPLAGTGCKFKIYEESSEVPAEDKENWPVTAGRQTSLKTVLREHPLEVSQQRQPAIEMPRQKQPSLEMSQQKQPSLNLSQQKQPSLNVSHQKQPSFDMSQQKQPSLNMPEQKQPSFDMSQQKLPSLNMPEQKQPSFDMSQQKLPPLNMPEQKQPSFDMSQQKLPSLNMSQQKQPSFDLSHQKQPAFDMSQQKQPPLNMSQQKHPSVEISQQKLTSHDMSQQKHSSLDMSQQKQPSLNMSQKKQPSFEMSQQKQPSQQREPLFSVYCDNEHAGDDSLFVHNKYMGGEDEMEGAENLPSEMTFLPALSSTRNFTSLVQNGHSFVPFEDASNADDGQKVSVSEVKSDRVSENVNSESNASNSQMKSGDTKRQSNVFGDLSPIIECSDEDIKGQVTTNSTAVSSTSCLSSNMSMIPKMAESLHSTNNDTGVALSKMGQHLDGNTFHSINIDNYQPPANDKKLKEMMDQSIAIDPNDPFDTDLIDTFLARLPHPLTDLPNCHSLTEMMPDLIPGKTVSLGKHKYHIKKHIAQGAFAKVYLVERKLTGKKTQQEVMKVQKPACLWEFYICTELSARLQNLNLSRAATPGVMSINEGYFYINGSCMTNTHHQYGTLLDVVNTYRCSADRFPPSVVTLIVLDLLYVMEMMHKCHIIHGDIKPDNILLINMQDRLEVPDDLREFLDKRPLFIKLIDFGQSIDMKMFPEGTTFTVSVETSGFKCIEMKTNRPWTYQTDLFGLIGTIHMLYFMKYMNIYQNNGEWKMTSKFRRSPDSDLLQKLFSDLMSIPSCSQLPDLGEYRKQLEEVYVRSNKAHIVRTCLERFRQKLKERQPA